jgi:F-type H+-transporting ATPase subunit delta
MSIKKYVKALIETESVDRLQDLYSVLSKVNDFSDVQKYNLIITSPILSNDEKVKFLVDLLQVNDEKAVNLLKLLAQNNRLKELPELVFLLKDAIAFLSGSYEGYVHTKEPINENKVKEIEEKLSKKFGKNINLTQSQSNKDGIQVYVDSLNVEVAVYEEDIKTKLITNIIRAI